MSEEKNIPQEEGKSEQQKNEKVNEHFPEDSHAPKPEASNQQQVTETMEVHHHGHVPHQKKWKEYLFQFLMLFFAVFCGFLAENQREHFIEHKRAREYAKSLYQDLKNDTAEVSKGTRSDSLTNLMIDSLVEFAGSTNPDKKSGQLYYYMRLASWLYTIDWNKATLNQLINSGNLRYFTNTELVTKISEYNTVSSLIWDLQNSIVTHRNRALPFRDQILKAQYAALFKNLSMDDILTGKEMTLFDSLRNISLPVQNNNPDLLNSYANAIQSTQSNRNFLLSTAYPRAWKQATEILVLLKKEYDIK